MMRMRSVNLFQFHYGAIKSSINVRRIIIDKIFQFHYGAIKSAGRFHDWLNLKNFNSTMVRLKVSQKSDIISL